MFVKLLLHREKTVNNLWSHYQVWSVGKAKLRVEPLVLEALLTVILMMYYYCHTTYYTT